MWKRRWLRHHDRHRHRCHHPHQQCHHHHDQADRIRFVHAFLGVPGLVLFSSRFPGSTVWNWWFLKLLIQGFLEPFLFVCSVSRINALIFFWRCRGSLVYISIYDFFHVFWITDVYWIVFPRFLGYFCVFWGFPGSITLIIVDSGFFHVTFPRTWER